MPSRRIYIETTVASYFVARRSRDLLVAARQEATHELWPKLSSEFETYVSALVFEEARRGDPGQAALRLDAIRAFPMLEVDEEARVLAATLVAARSVPAEFPEDALHIAVAAINGMDAIVTWNFAHMNNPFTRTTIRQTVENAGYACPEICSPDELLEELP